MYVHFMACEMSARGAVACICGTHIVGYVRAWAQMSHSCTAAHLLAATGSMFLLIIDMVGYASVREHHCYTAVRGRGRQRRPGAACEGPTGRRGGLCNGGTCFFANAAVLACFWHAACAAAAAAAVACSAANSERRLPCARRCTPARHTGSTKPANLP